MDPKYEFRYTANANNAARAASLTGRGALNVMQSHCRPLWIAHAPWTASFMLHVWTWEGNL